jgi:hypothetical protein
MKDESTGLPPSHKLKISAILKPGATFASFENEEESLCSQFLFLFWVINILTQRLYLWSLLTFSFSVHTQQPPEKQSRWDCC